MRQPHHEVWSDRAHIIRGSHSFFCHPYSYLLCLADWSWVGILLLSQTRTSMVCRYFHTPHNCFLDSDVGSCFTDHWCPFNLLDILSYWKYRLSLIEICFGVSVLSLVSSCFIFEFEILSDRNTLKWTVIVFLHKVHHAMAAVNGMPYLWP